VSKATKNLKLKTPFPLCTPNPVILSQKISVNLCPSVVRFQSKSKGGKIENPQTTKIFPTPLTPYFIITYPFSVFSFFLCGECFFDQNAPVRPIMGRFYIPILSEIKFNETKNLSAAPYGGLASA